MIGFTLVFMALVICGTWLGAVAGTLVARRRLRSMLRELAPESARKSDPPSLPLELYQAALSSRNAAREAKVTAERIVAQLAQH